MRKLNTILAAVALGLVLVSALSYRASVERAERFERGQRFLPNLNPDQVAEIVIEKGGDTVRLKRQGDRFVLPTAHGYPAKTEAVNRFIRDVLELSLEKEVGRGKALEKELGLAEAGEEAEAAEAEDATGDDTLEVTFKDSAGKTMVAFLVGHPFGGEGSSYGNYVRRASGDDRTIYLTGKRIYLSTSEDDFLDTDLLDVKAADIEAIAGPGYRLETNEAGDLELVEPTGEPSAQVNTLKNALSYLRFTEHHLANAPEVQGLDFGPPVEFDLKDHSGYRVQVAERDGKHYLRLEGYHRTPQVEIRLDADEEEVREKSEVLARGDEIEEFNEFHGSWVYEVSEGTAEKFGVGAGELVES